MKLSPAFTVLLTVISWGVSVQAAPRLIRRQADDAQTSLKLDPGVLQKGLATDGTAGADAGTAASLTTTNNFVNFCLLFTDSSGKQGVITNGQQVKGGSCNPTPMGSIPASTAIPSSRITSPTLLQNFGVNQTFTVTMKIGNMDTGFFTNADATFLGAPQQLNAQGQIQGHSHITIQKMNGIQDPEVPDPTKFVFFKGLNDPAKNGVLTADVSSGLDAGTYRICSINTSANHTPVIAPVAQHGPIDDCTVITVGDKDDQDAKKLIGASAAGKNNNDAAAGANNAAAAAPPAATGANNATAAPTDANNAAAAPPAATDAAAAAPASADPSKSFLTANGQAAQQLNAKFATLTADSPCNEGDQGCIGDGFAQCVGGKFQNVGCAGGTKCFALPLVNSAGTSITCDTEADATARIAATGVTGGITGSG